MIYFALFLAEVAVLLFLSRIMSKTLSKFLSINLLSVLFLPGIIIHELSHMFTAVILFVPVGQMEFAPKRTGDSVKLGSVEIAKTDPIRRSLIGFAPIFAGLTVIIGAIYLFNLNIAFLQSGGLGIFIAVIFILGYLLFAISNTMFSSPRDMEGTLEVLIALTIVLVASYLLGLRLPPGYPEKIFTEGLVTMIQKIALFLLAPIAVDLVILGAIRMFRRT